MVEEEKDKKEETETGKPEKEAERENKEEKPKKEEKSGEAVSIKIKKDDIWKYSTILLLALLLVGAVIIFTGGGMKDGGNNGNAPSPAPTPSPEPPSTAQVSIDDDAFLGNRNAPVTIVEFSDYSCSFCGRFYSQTLPSIKSKYIETGKVKFVYRDFPVLGATGQAAAEASECVREMGGDEAFWKYHDTIFENQPMLSGGREKLLEWASEMGHDIEECLNSNKFAGEVQKDMADGRKIGITGTPGFVIGKTDGNSVRGPVVRGAYPFTAFEQIIDAELAS